MIATFQRGETLVLPLFPRLPGESIRAALKPAGAGFSVPPATVAEAAVFAVAETEIDGQSAWTLTLSSASSETLPVGNYVMDARIQLADGQVQITNPVKIVIEERVTGP